MSEHSNKDEEIADFYKLPASANYKDLKAFQNRVLTPDESWKVAGENTYFYLFHNSTRNRWVGPISETCLEERLTLFGGVYDIKCGLKGKIHRIDFGPRKVTRRKVDGCTIYTILRNRK